MTCICGMSLCLPRCWRVLRWHIESNDSQHWNLGTGTFLGSASSLSQLRNGLTNWCGPTVDLVLVELLRFSQAMLWHAPEHPRGYCCDLSTRKFSGATSELEGTSDIHLTEWRSWVGPERFWYVFKCFNSSPYRVNTKCRLAFAVIHLSLLVYTILKKKCWQCWHAGQQTAPGLVLGCFMRIMFVTALTTR
jgi:hypothetical protein